MSFQDLARESSQIFPVIVRIRSLVSLQSCIVRNEWTLTRLSSSHTASSGRWQFCFGCEAGGGDLGRGLLGCLSSLPRPAPLRPLQAQTEVVWGGGVWVWSSPWDKPLQNRRDRQRCRSALGSDLGAGKVAFHSPPPRNQMCR